MHLHARRIAWALVALFTLGGLGYSMALGTEPRFPDERDYVDIAGSLAHAGIYSLDGKTPNALRPPGYPLLIAPVAGVAGALAGPMAGASAGADEIAAFERALTVHGVRTLQFLGLALAALLLGSLAVPRRTRSRPPADARAGVATASPGTGDPRAWAAVAMLAGLAGYPVLVYSAGTLFPQTALLVLAASVLWLLERARPHLVSATCIGLLCGAAAQVSPTALTLVPMALLHTALSGRWRTRHVVAVAVAATLLPGAWLARNRIVLDETILFSTNLAHNLDNAVLELDPLGADEDRAPDDVFGYGAERLLQLVQEPDAYLRRLRDHFAWRNDMHVKSESSQARDVVMLITYTTLLALVALRLALARRQALVPAERSVLALYAMTAAFHALVFVRIRYRLPFDFLLLLPALNAVLIGAETLLAKRGPTGAPRREPSVTTP